jgi:hypothetical protein
MRMLNLAWMAAICLFSTTCKNDKPASVNETLQQMAKVPGINAGSGTYDIRQPAGWTKAEKQISGLNVTVMLAPKHAGAPFQSNITILSQALENASFDKYFDGVIIGAGQTMQMLEKGDKNINGLSGKWAKFTGKAMGRQLDGIIYGIPGGNDIVYVITCETPIGQMEKYQPFFDEAINSFQIHGMTKVSK